MLFRSNFEKLRHGTQGLGNSESLLVGEGERERELRKCEKETPRKSMRTKNKGCLATRGPFGTCV